MARPRFLADEDLRGSIIQATRRFEAALEIVAIVEQGIASATDDEVLDYAWQNRWLLVSHDVNTMKGLAEHRIADGPGIHGLFLVPQDRSTRESAECLVLIWTASEFEEWHNRIVYLPF